MDINVHVEFGPGQNDWVARRMVALCEQYESSDAIFSRPSHDKTTALLGFAREVAESIGFRSSGGDE